MATDQDSPLEVPAPGPDFAERLRVYALRFTARELGVSDATQRAMLTAYEAGHEFNGDDYERVKDSVETDGLEMDVSFDELGEDVATSAELLCSPHYQRTHRQLDRGPDLDEGRRILDRLDSIRAVTRNSVRRSRCPRRSTAAPRRRSTPVVSQDCSTRDSSSSRTSGTDPGSEDDPELPTGPGARCHCGCGATLPASKRSDSRWISDAHRKRFTRNAPQQSEPRRDTREPADIQADIEKAVAKRAAIWRARRSGWIQLDADQRRQLADLEGELNGKGDLWAQLRIARAARAALEDRERPLAGAPTLQQPSINRDSGSGDGTGDSDHKRKRIEHFCGKEHGVSRADRRRAQAKRSIEEAGRGTVADAIEAWRRRNGFNVSELPARRQPVGRTVAA